MLKLILSLFCFVSLYAFESKEFFVPTKDAKLFCRVMGKGKPLIVIHGGPGLSQDYLLPEMGRLAETHLVVFYDQRGCGQSIGEITQETVSLNSYVDDLEMLRKQLGFEKIAVLGHSWGGFLAMNYAIAYPDHIEKLVLSNSMPATAEDFNLFVQEWFKRMAPFQAELSKIHDNPEDTNRLTFRTYCFLPDKANLLSLKVTKEASDRGSKVYDIFRKKVFEQAFDLTPSLKGLSVPTLVIHGDFDPVPLLTAQHIHEAIPHSQFVIMKECGHFPYVEDPAVYFRHLKAFLLRGGSKCL